MVCRSLDAALVVCSSLRSCTFAADDRSFYPDDPALAPLGVWPDVLQRAERVAVGQSAVVSGNKGITLFLVNGLVAAVSSRQPLRVAWLEDICCVQCVAGGLESLPDYIALPRDEAGGPIIPATLVTANLEAQEAWACELGTLDGVTNSIVYGKLVISRVYAAVCPLAEHSVAQSPVVGCRGKTTRQVARRSHGRARARRVERSFADLATILRSGAEGTAPFYRLITDARFAIIKTGASRTLRQRSLAARSIAVTSPSASTFRMHTTFPSGLAAAASSAARGVRSSRLATVRMATPVG